ncbi:unnamed protein product [Ambrosiozyma monospora]|uniref:Unnamed protein product n=1 Tax=Ambrosiozyma monospora TaxID=43982 RepID=A0ACB5TDD7_AMBMO|nr:unnamed protein product [Ambrosiozyma monospora]
MSVLVSGANGFLAAHITDDLLKHGYPVVGTVRSTAKSDPFLKHFKEKYPDAKLEYEIVQHITEPDAFTPVLQKHPDIEYVIHTAASTAIGALEGQDMKDVFLTPAIEGSLSILRSVHEHAPQVKNVVMTSSIAATTSDFYAQHTKVYRPDGWNEIKWEDNGGNETLAYAISKVYAEKAARNFVKENNVKYKFTTVNPAIVVGPQLLDSHCGKTLNISNQWMLGAVEDVKTGI